MNVQNISAKWRKAARTHRCLLRHAGKALILALLMTQSVLAERTVGPVTNVATNQSYPGKVIWVDLVTNDVSQAASFYESVFGWDITLDPDGSFAEASYQGRPVAAIAAYEEDAPDDGARWLISISTTDVDATASAVRSNGGKILEGPVDLANRGRYILAADAGGAMLMFLQASGGDPLDESPTPNNWLWAELWADDPAGAVNFYEAVAGYKSITLQDSDGSDVMVMGRDGAARASVVKIPWEDVGPNWLPYLLVSDIKHTLESVEKNGGSVVLHAMKDTANTDVAIVADPTGGVFAIQQRGK